MATKSTKADAAASLRRGAIVSLEVAKETNAKAIHDMIDRILNLKGCRACGLIGKIDIWDHVLPAVDVFSKENLNVAGFKGRVFGG